VDGRARDLAGILSPYRVLDLTEELGPLCAKILGDLGADVIKVERPGGDPSRWRGPFAEDRPHPERSLPWAAFNASKRSITLDLETAAGRQQLLELAQEFVWPLMGNAQRFSD